jgi:hypothetical protein
MTNVDDCRIVDLRKVTSPQGSLTPVYPGEDIPFQIARVYYLYDVPGGATRAGHAHRELQQLIVSVMGSFDIVLDDGSKKKTVRLDRAYFGLYMPNMIWREIVNFSSGGVCLVFASLPYEEADYIREYADFTRLKEAKQVVSPE